MAYANGKIPYSAMTALSTGGYLLAGAAAAFEVWRIQAARAGFDLRPTSASDTFRPYGVQERIFRDRYRPGNLAGRPGFTRDVRYWPGQGYWTRRTGTAAAAVPGTSNHGKALAVDIKNAGAFGGPFHAWMSRTGPALGWSNVEGRSVNEPWHWVHSGAHLVDNPISGGGSVTVPSIPGAPAPITPEEDLNEDQDKALSRVWQIAEALEDYILDRNGRGYQADSRVLGVLPDKRNADKTVATVLTTAEGQVLRDDITRAAARAVAETSAAYHQTIAALSGIKPGAAQVDVAALAAALKADLPKAVVAELANKLKG